MIKIKDGQVYSTTGKIVRRRGNGACGLRHSALPGDKESGFEELDEMPHYSEDEYKAKVVALIRRRYDQNDENGVLRQRDTKPDEFEAYNAYVEQCKAQAKAALEAAWQEVNAPVVPDGNDQSASGVSLD